MTASKNQSKFQHTAYILVNIQIWINCYNWTRQEKETFKLGSSLPELILHKNLMIY